jgi:hypothetical protein
MEEWKWWLRWVKRFKSQMRHYRRVFTDGVKHDRLFELRRDFADNVDTLGFQLFQVR